MSGQQHPVFQTIGARAMRLQTLRLAANAVSRTERVLSCATYWLEVSYTVWSNREGKSKSMQHGPPPVRRRSPLSVRAAKVNFCLKFRLRLP